VNKIDEVGLKTKAVEGNSNELPIQVIKGFNKVKLEEESLLVPSLKAEGVDDLLGDNDVGRNVPILDKSILGVINEVGEMRFEPIS
jgi:hypothetical protein